MIEYLIFIPIFIAGLLSGIVGIGISWYFCRDIQKANTIVMAILVCIALIAFYQDSGQLFVFAIAFWLSSQFLRFHKEIFIREMQRQIVKKVIEP